MSGLKGCRQGLRGAPRDVLKQARLGLKGSNQVIPSIVSRSLDDVVGLQRLPSLILVVSWFIRAVGSEQNELGCTLAECRFGVIQESCSEVISHLVCKIPFVLWATDDPFDEVLKLKPVGGCRCDNGSPVPGLGETQDQSGQETEVDASRILGADFTAKSRFDLAGFPIFGEDSKGFHFGMT